jgi:hypothetical protein
LGEICLRCGDGGLHFFWRESHFREHCGTLVEEMFEVIERGGAETEFVHLCADCSGR